MRNNGTEPEYPGFEPTLVTEVELSQPLPALSAVSPTTGRPYTRAQSLVRLHGSPLGLVDLQLPSAGLSADAYADEIWRSLAPQIQMHLSSDGLSDPIRLSAQGIQLPEPVRCEQRRQHLLAQPPNVSVIIPSRDAGDRLAPTLSSVFESHYPRSRFEVVVVDNVPQTPATADFLDGYDEDVVYLRADVSGSASARNKGLAEARGEIVAFIDDDTIVDRYWLAELALAFDLEPRVACVTQLILPLELDTPAQRWFEEYGGASKGFERRIFDLQAHRPDDPLFPFNAGSFGSGGSMAFDRSVLRSLGGFDPALGNGTPALGGVDIEAFFRVIIEGYALVYQPTAMVWHRHRPEYPVLRNRIFAYGVGLTAFLLRSIVARPDLAAPLFRRLGRGLMFALSPRSVKHAAKSSDYPSELRWAELAGMLYGPIGYVRSARRFGRPIAVRRVA